jgi:hypothetical protein
MLKGYFPTSAPAEPNRRNAYGARGIPNEQRARQVRYSSSDRRRSREADDGRSEGATVPRCDTRIGYAQQAAVTLIGKETLLTCKGAIACAQRIVVVNAYRLRGRKSTTLSSDDQGRPRGGLLSSLWRGRLRAYRSTTPGPRAGQARRTARRAPRGSGWGQPIRRGSR